MTELVAWMGRIPEAGLYAALWIGAALENFIPAVPADTFVALGGFLVGVGRLEAWLVFTGTWLFNVGGALFVYRMSHRHGRVFFERGMGRHVLRSHQMQRVEEFYGRWGTTALFVSRFLPGIRAVVPIFAGVTHQPWSRVVLPISLASAIWYGGLVGIGVFAGRNLPLLDALLGRINRTLALAAAVIGGLILLWWVRSRRRPPR